MNNKLLLALVFGMSVTAAQAAKVDGAPAAACDGLKVATGPAGKGYSKLFSDMTRVSKNALSLCEVNTEGGLDNLTTLSIKKADVGIVSLDALKKMAEGDQNIKNLLVVAALNSNYLHIVTSANGYTFEGPKKYGVLKGESKSVRISKMSELRNAPVALVGSAQLLVRQLDKSLGYNMRYIDVDSDDAAFKKVIKGEAYAAFTVAGWPHGQITRLAQNSGLTLAGFDVPAPSTYNVRPFSYKNIGVYNVQALSVQNVLVTRPFSGSKTADVAALKQMLQRELPELKDGDYEPGWNEIKSLDAKVDWASFTGGAAPAAAVDDAPAAPVPKKKK
ncbi:TAXI family TRAP transporter solute-binding subunit [Massilia sp. TSP1-1-2]|uniref:TAXI family TRAP transporter solute-binding subunit n=1 Tax=Massilia sp. TSP1-1-2 TaxID=2804649 RepID=UPI003CE8CB80